MKVLVPYVCVTIYIFFYSTLFDSTSFFPFLQFSGPLSSFLPFPLFVWRDCRLPVALEWGSEWVCSKIFTIVAPSGSLQYCSLPSGLSFFPQPLYLPSLSPSLWPRLSPVSSAPSLQFYPASICDCMTPDVAFFCKLRGPQVRRRCSIQQLWKRHQQKETDMLCS